METEKERLDAIESNMDRIDKLEQLQKEFKDKVAAMTKTINDNQ